MRTSCPSPPQSPFVLPQYSCIIILLNQVSVYVTVNYQVSLKLSQKILLISVSKPILPMFSSRSFMVLGLIFKSLIHFKFVFIIEKVVQFDFFAHSC